MCFTIIKIPAIYQLFYLTLQFYYILSIFLLTHLKFIGHSQEFLHPRGVQNIVISEDGSLRFHFHHLCFASSLYETVESQGFGVIFSRIGIVVFTFDSFHSRTLIQSKCMACHYTVSYHQVVQHSVWLICFAVIPCFSHLIYFLFGLVCKESYSVRIFIPCLNLGSI